MDTPILPYIEALIFVAENPLPAETIRLCLAEAFGQEMGIEQVNQALVELKAKFDSTEHAIEVLEIAGGFQFMSKPAYFGPVAALIKLNNKKRLSQPALETLAIIAYKQPISKSELESIRGVSCDYSIQKLLEKELVSILGRSDGVGRPLLYGTSEKFMHYFGLKSMKDLPKPKEFKLPDSEIGEADPDLPADNLLSPISVHQEEE